MDLDRESQGGDRWFPRMPAFWKSIRKQVRGLENSHQGIPRPVEVPDFTSRCRGGHLRGPATCRSTRPSDRSERARIRGSTSEAKLRLRADSVLMAGPDSGGLCRGVRIATCSLCNTRIPRRSLASQPIIRHTRLSLSSPRHCGIPAGKGRRTSSHLPQKAIGTQSQRIRMGPS